LEFTSLLKELLPVVEAPAGNYREAKSAADLESLLKARSSNVPLAIAVESVVAAPAVEEQEEPDAIGLLPLQHSIVADTSKATTIALAVEPGSALTISADARADSVLKQGLADEKIPKAIHDWKTASHVLTGVELAGVEHDTRLYSYLLDPTYSSHRLPDLALPHFNLKLAGSLAEAADITLRLTTTLRKEVEECGLLKLYEEIDRPLLPVLARMEEAGVAIDRAALAKMSERLEREIEAKTQEIYECCGGEFNVNSPRQLGDVLFNKLNLPKPVKYGKGKTISTAVDVLEELAASHDAPKLVLEYRQLAKLKSTYVDALPALLNSGTGRLHTTFDQTGTTTGRLSSANPNLQNIPIR